MRAFCSGTIWGGAVSSLLGCGQRAEPGQLAVATIHQRAATLHQAAHAGAQGAVGVPVGRDIRSAEQALCDLAQRGAVLAGIEGL
jgi:hypothetical protein